MDSVRMSNKLYSLFKSKNKTRQEYNENNLLSGNSWNGLFQKSALSVVLYAAHIPWIPIINM